MAALKISCYHLGASYQEVRCWDARLVGSPASRTPARPDRSFAATPRLATLTFMNHGERQEAAALLRRVLDAVDSGALAADGPAAVAVVRRMEGALLAVEAMEQEHRH